MINMGTAYTLRTGATGYSWPAVALSVDLNLEQHLCHANEWLDGDDAGIAVMNGISKYGNRLPLHLDDRALRRLETAMISFSDAKMAGNEKLLPAALPEFE